MCDIEGCDLTFHKNNKCILHSDDKDKNIKEFWEEIRNKVLYDIKSKNFSNVEIEKTITFENIYFPNFETNNKFSKIQSNNSFFHKEKMIFELKVIFKDCTFLEKSDFQKITFKKGLSFENCIFEKELNFKDTIFQRNSKVRIQNCPKITNANFENTTFEDLVDFYGSTFERSINFERTNFKNISVFEKAIFKEDVNFKYTTFGKLAQFGKTVFEKKLNLEDTIIKEEINFLKVKTSNDENLKVENIENRETARIIKHSFEKQDNIIEANKFYALEMEKRKEELSTDIEKGKNIFEYFIFHIHKFSSEHSTNPLLVLFWILMISLFYSYCYDFLEKKDFYIECFDEKYLKSWIYIFYNFKEIFDLFLVITIILGIFLLVYLVCNQKNGKLGLMIIFTVCSISFYIFLTKDFYLFLVAKNFNPFSIMTKGEDLSFSMLVYKSVIAYLIYQFIISIRQNTRRK